jgi:Flp pilus assembly protein TadD
MTALQSRQRRRRPKQAPARPRSTKKPVVAMVKAQPSSLEFENFDGTAMFDTLGQVRALPADECSRAIVRRSIAEARGYSDEELFALAEVGYHYFRSGGLRLALVVFEGLTAIKPDESYFWLALGLVTDYLGDKRRAATCYETAGRLDPNDPRPDLNLAELCLERSDRRRATAYLRRSAKKAELTGDAALENKAHALLGLVGAAA